MLLKGPPASAGGPFSFVPIPATKNKSGQALAELKRIRLRRDPQQSGDHDRFHPATDGCPLLIESRREHPRALELQTRGSVAGCDGS